MAEPIPSADEPDVRVVADVIRSRRTINLYEPDPVDPRLLLEACELARWAPNHRLTEPWRFYLLGPETSAAAIDCWAGFEAEMKGQAAGDARRKRLEGIPGHFILTSAKHEDPLIELENYAACCCAAQNLMLYLWQRGIGTKWTSGAITRERRLFELIGIDADAESIVGYFWYGRPKVYAGQKRRDVETFVVSLP